MRAPVRPPGVRAASVLPLLAAIGACSDSGEPAKVALAPSVLFPRGLLDNVRGVRLSVYDATDGLDCNATTGKLTASATPIAAVDLAATLPSGAPCPSSGRFCGSVTVSKSDTPRLFQAQAATATSDDFADGCTRTVVNQDALPLKIVMMRNVPPSVCGDGTIGATEQCEPPDPLCDASCHTGEIVLSTGGGRTDMRDPFLVWPAGSGTGGRFLAFFSDFSYGIATPEVSMRPMSDALAPLAGYPSSVYLPNSLAQSPGPSPMAQSQPTAAVIGRQYFVAFQDGDTSGTNGLDIHLRSMDDTFTAQQDFKSAIGVNGGADGGGEPNIQSHPSMAAGPGGALFIAWQDDSAQTISGRTFMPAPPRGTLGAQQVISTGSGNANVQLAPTANGWIAVWESGGDVKMRTLDANGAPSGAETVVNANTGGLQDHPSVATLPDGRFLVVWSDHAAASGAKIVAQRFSDAGDQVAGDQSTPVSTTDGADQVAPRAAAMNALGGSFVVTWLDARSQHVRARLLGGSSGFLFNNVDGRSGDFQVSIGDGRSRTNPTVAVGGSGPYIAFGWEDQSASAPTGITARRFPQPTQQ